MRVILIGGIGSLVAGVALAISRVSDGYVEGIAFLLAISIATVTVGIAVASGVSIWVEAAGTRRAARIRGQSVGRLWSRTRLPCKTCRRSMVQIDFLWVCTTCDRVAAER